MRVYTCEKCIKTCKKLGFTGTCTSFLSYGKAAKIQEARLNTLANLKPKQKKDYDAPLKASIGERIKK